MSKSLVNEVLLQSVEAPLISEKNERIGEIIEVTRNGENYYIEYIIVKSNKLTGPGIRYFAIPASSRFIKITEENIIIFQFQKDDLQNAKGVAADQCPKPNLRFGKSIFELHNYQSPDQRTVNYLTKERQ